MKKILCVLFFLCQVLYSFSQELYINPNTGDDSNIGTQAQPLRSLKEGVDRINNYDGDKPIALKLEPGLYSIDKNLTINFNENFTENHPLTIEASILPDDPTWKPESMPVLVSTSLPEKTGGDDCTYTIRVETDHTSINGLKFLGNPSLTTKHFCIYRLTDTLSSLNVSQCMFLGDRDIMPIQVAVMVNGHGIDVEHCVFSNCRWAAIYYYAENFKNPITNSSFTHCIVKDCYYGAIWTSLVDSDFKFDNNIVNNCKFFWIKNHHNKYSYTLNNCIVSDVQIYNGEWQEGNKKVQGDYNFMENNVIKGKEVHFITWDENNSFHVDHRFLHIEKDSLGYDLNSGIFRNNNQ